MAVLLLAPDVKVRVTVPATPDGCTGIASNPSSSDVSCNEDFARPLLSSSDAGPEIVAVTGIAYRSCTTELVTFCTATVEEINDWTDALPYKI